MVDAPALESILKEIEHNEGVHEAMLVGLAGTYLAGTVPKWTHSYRCSRSSSVPRKR